MITINIVINSNTIYSRTAVNVTEIDDHPITDNSMCLYEVDSGQIIKHRFGDGAIVLAKKMLDTIKEVK